MNKATDIWGNIGATNLVSVIARRAQETPDAIAIIDAEGETSYAALMRRTEAIHAALIARGLEPQAPVAVLMDRRADLVAALLGILRAGGIYAPFDPHDPPERVARMIARSGAQTVIASGGRAPGGVAARDILDLDAVPNLPAGRDVPPIAPGGDRLAYLLFTSGTTGEPKAVQVSHANTLHLLRSACDLLRFTRADRYLATSTIAFDASVTELFLPLCTGASLLLRGRDILLAPHLLAADVRAFGVTVVQTAPSVWAALLREVPDFPQVRIAITHGEAVTPELALRLCAQGQEAWNLYGPTETTVWAIGWRLGPDQVNSVSPVSAPIGRPLGHIRAYVVDPEGVALDGDAQGELWLGGPSVARGYLGNGALTQARFRPLGGDRAYWTGDLVHRDAAGVLHYLGRIDDQMQIRGVRLEPQEVEAALLRDPRVAQAAVTWFERGDGARGVLGAIVARAGTAPTVQDLHAGLTAHLPRHMMPTLILSFAQLPMTASGKIDRAALRVAALAQGGKNAAPERRTDTERRLGALWHRVLGGGEAVPEDNFFTIGGDSLTAVHMVTEAEILFGIRLPLHIAFEAPTLAALASRIDAERLREELNAQRGFVFHLAGPGTDGQGPPLFFCHPDLGLARSGVWTPPFAIHAIWYWARGEGLARGRSLEALAAHHLMSVRAVQAVGPYRLGGYSFGGLLAFEMAQQLRAAGETVELLFLLDPTAPRQASIPLPTPEGQALPVAARAWRRLQRVAIADGGGAALRDAAQAAARALAAAAARPLHHLRCKLTALRLKAPGLGWLPFQTHPWRAFANHAMPLLARYQAVPYDGRAVLVLSAEGGHNGKGAYGALLRPDTAMITLEGSHRGLFDAPALGQWLAALESEAADARARSQDKVQVCVGGPSAQT
jgi:amino acid adenylation domain-containing protein